MKKVFAAICLGSLVALASGCATHNVSQYPSTVNAMVEAPLKADIQVGERITGASSSSILFGFINLGSDTKYADGVNYGVTGGPLALMDPMAKVKSAAAYNALSASGADIIIAPRYTVDVSDYLIYKQIKVNVTGYKGTIKKIN